jgi:hypothetical protein
MLARTPATPERPPRCSRARGATARRAHADQREGLRAARARKGAARARARRRRLRGGTERRRKRGGRGAQAQRTAEIGEAAVRRGPGSPGSTDAAKRSPAGSGAKGDRRAGGGAQTERKEEQEHAGREKRGAERRGLEGDRRRGARQRRDPGGAEGRRGRPTHSVRNPEREAREAVPWRSAQALDLEKS